MLHSTNFYHEIIWKSMEAKTYCYPIAFHMQWIIRLRNTTEHLRSARGDQIVAEIHKVPQTISLGKIGSIKQQRSRTFHLHDAWCMIVLGLRQDHTSTLRNASWFWKLCILFQSSFDRFGSLKMTFPSHFHGVFSLHWPVQSGLAISKEKDREYLLRQVLHARFYEDLIKYSISILFM